METRWGISDSKFLKSLPYLYIMYMRELNGLNPERGGLWKLRYRVMIISESIISLCHNKKGEGSTIMLAAGGALEKKSRASPAEKRQPPPSQISFLKRVRYMASEKKSNMRLATHFREFGRKKKSSEFGKYLD